MNEGWVGEEYIVLFEEKAPELERAYSFSDFLPGYRLVGLRGGNDFLVEDGSGCLFTVPAVPLVDRFVKPFSFQDSLSKLASDDRLRGKIKWYFIPPAFGRNPTEGINLIWITFEDHIEVVKWWNELNRRRGGINILDWSEDDELAVTLATYNLIIPNRPEQPDLYCNRGLTLYNLKQFDTAIADFNKALSLDPEYADAYAHRAEIYSGAGELTLALADLDKFVSLDPTKADIFIYRGCLHEDLGSPTSALMDFDEAIRLDPTNAMAYSNRGSVHSQLGQVQRAIEDYGTAIRCDPCYPNSYSNRAFAYYKIGEYEKGIADCEQALALRPNHATTYINRAHCFAGLGNSERAAADFRFALEQCSLSESERKEALDGLRSLD